MPQDFQKLEFYKKAHQLVLEIYAVAKKLPDGDQEYGIGAEICQNAMQIPATIVRGSVFEESEFREHLEEARLTLRTVDMHLTIMHRWDSSPSRSGIGCSSWARRSASC